jgi:hypothetical protein
MKAVPFEGDFDSKNYNLFLLSEHWEANSHLMQLKCLAL